MTCVFRTGSVQLSIARGLLDGIRDLLALPMPVQSDGGDESVGHTSVLSDDQAFVGAVHLFRES